MEAFHDADLVICLGDLVDDCENEADTPIMLKRVSELISSFNLPFYCLRGNHDCQLFDEDAFYEAVGGRPPFIVRMSSVALILLNANYKRDGQPYTVNGVDWTDTALPPEQMLKLKRALDDPEISDAYVFIHQNLDPNVQYQHILANADKVRKILEDSGKVRKVIQGHYHPGCDSVIGGIEYHTLPAMCEGESNFFEQIEI